jgi:Transcriptional regulator of heat shock gene
VLRAIVEDYVATQEPVGSKALVERHQLQVSPATIRNDMAVLEDEGYIRQPHTSAGRVPTDRGYRCSSTSCPGSSRCPRPSGGRSSGSWSAWSTSTTWCTAPCGCSPAHPPGRGRPVPEPVALKVRHLELVPVSTTRLMLVMIADTGRVEQRVVELPDADARGRRAAAARGDQRQARRAAAVGHPPLVEDLTEEIEPALRPGMSVLATLLLETLVERGEERIALAGTANLTRGGILDFQGRYGRSSRRWRRRSSCSS